jgi:hypothetical protein
VSVVRSRDPSDGPSYVTRRHTASLRSHREVLGRATVAVFLLSRTLVFSAGCGPSAGEQGGKCKDNGCNLSCNEGLMCDNATNTCVESPQDEAAPLSECNYRDDDGCAAPSIAYACQNDATPAGMCTQGATDWAGNTKYCCAAECNVATMPQLACSSPAVTFWCDNPLTPRDRDASLSCLDFDPGEHWSGQCCAPTGTCFAESFRLMLPCAAYDQQYFCTGSTAIALPGKVCTEAPTDAGAGIRGFCCIDSEPGDAASATDSDDGPNMTGDAPTAGE